MSSKADNKPDKNEIIQALSNDLYENLRIELGDKYITRFIDHSYAPCSATDKRAIKKLCQAFLQTLNNKLANILTEIEKEVKMKQ